MNEQDKKFFKSMVIELINYSLDDLEDLKSIISKDSKNLDNGEMVQHCATKIVDLTIRVKTELAGEI
jgi:hypothetical protein